MQRGGGKKPEILPPPFFVVSKYILTSYKIGQIVASGCY